MSQLVIIFLELIVLSIMVYFILRLYISFTKKSEVKIKNSVRDGVKSAFIELEYEKEIEKEMVKKLIGSPEK